MKLKYFLAALLLVIAINFTPILVHAQNDGSSGGEIVFGSDEPPQDPDTSVPFDGGVSMLVAAGVAYGIKKKYDHNKKATNEENKSI